MLAGKGYGTVINMSGGIREWNGGVALGSEELGLGFFTGKESAEEALVAAYSLEEGLRDFYLSMGEKVKRPDVRALFRKLSEIEIKHQDRIFEEYVRLKGKRVNRAEFEKGAVAKSVEGGLTTGEYVDHFKPDLESAVDVVSLAMSIEAQALDLYKRAADRSDGERSRKVLSGIADEERSHLALLGKLMETLP